MSDAKQDACSRCAAARREFLAQSAVGGIAGVAAIGLPALVGVATMVDPLVGAGGGSSEVRLASLSGLAEDGTPLRVVVYLDKVDGWNTTPNQPVGGVWLRRKGETVQAFHQSCPHAGCGIQYNSSEGIFSCPCHGATFDLDGVRREASSESPRDLDALDVRVEGDDVYVTFQNFSFGTAKKEAI